MKATHTIRIERLRCEGLVCPLGIDALRPRLSWELHAGERGQKQTAYQVLVASAPETLAKGQGDLWDSGKVEAEASAHLAYGGTSLASHMRCHWSVRVWDRDDQVSNWSDQAFWEMGLLQPDDWRAAWIGMNPKEGAACYPWLRKTFVLDKPSTARVYIASLGYHELYVNGEKAGDDVLSPAVTQFSHRAFYLTHDVMPLLRKGTNCLAIWLGHGWYHAGNPGFSEIQRPGGPVVRAQLELCDGHGGKTIIGTDATWKASPSPIGKAGDAPCFGSRFFWSLLYDARLERPGWNRAEFDDSRWPQAQECAIAVPNVRAQMVQTNKITRVFTAVKIEPQLEASWLVDMGTNLSGWVKLRLPPMKAGQKIRLDYYDRLLDENGQSSGASGYDEYIASGERQESFCNRFNYQGFRYVRITGLPSAPAKDSVSALLINTDCESAGSFACSNKRLTAIHDMIFYTFRCLTLGGYMVDCPHYERLGYGGDGHASLEAALMMYDLEPLYRSWLAAWRDCQEPDGDMPHTAPSYYAGGGPYYCAFIIAAPWYVFRQYGDSSILSENYPAMQRWLAFVEANSKNRDLLDTWANTSRRNWFLGDWATPKGIDPQHLPSVKLVANCIRIYCYDIMAHIAAALDKRADAERYRAKADSLRPTVHKACFDPVAGVYADGDQIDLAFPLLTGVAPEEFRADIQKRLEEDILKENLLGVGLVGVPILVKTLMDMNRNDLIFAFTNHDAYPGWGYMLKNGATTTWEHWNGLRSHIHNCYNGIGTWFYQGLAGIRLDPAAPGFRHFLVRPAIVGDIAWVRAAYRSALGMIVCNWKTADDRLEMTVGVPVGATATVYFPAKEASGITESGQSAEKAVGVRYLRRENGAAVYEVESGTYMFAGAR